MPRTGRPRPVGTRTRGLVDAGQSLSGWMILHYLIEMRMAQRLRHTPERQSYLGSVHTGKRLHQYTCLAALTRPLAYAPFEKVESDPGQPRIQQYRPQRFATFYPQRYKTPQRTIIELLHILLLELFNPLVYLRVKLLRSQARRFLFLLFCLCFRLLPSRLDHGADQ